MTITGKSSLSISKKELQSSKLGATNFKKIRFAHKATAGETSIDLTSLNTPSQEMQQFVQPNVSVLTDANLQLYRSNLTLVSSARGVLQDYLSYNVQNSTTITFTEDFGPALEGEIFLGIIDSVPRNGLVGVDSNPIVATGTLSAGNQQFNVGQRFRTNANPNFQIGDVIVFLDGVQQYRNSGNAAAAPGADGNYHEISGGNGYSTIIEFNNSSTENRAVTVISNGTSIIRPDGSLIQELENVQGQLDSMIPVLADVAGVQETEFQTAPNNQDLKAFGDRVVSLEEPGSPGEPRLASNTEAGASLLPNGTVELDTGNGHGSTNTTVRRYTNNATTGDAFTYTDSIANGASITVNRDCIVSVSTTDRYSAGSSQLGFTINGTQLSTNLLSISDGSKRFPTSNSSAIWGQTGGTLRLNSGDVIRMQTAGIMDDGDDNTTVVIQEVVRLN